MKEKLNKELKLDIILLILSVALVCAFIACIVVIAISGQPALEILAQCTPWSMLIVLGVLFIGAFICAIKRDACIALDIEERKRDIMEHEYKERLNELMSKSVKGNENTSKRKTNGTTRKR